ncbi:response regulator [Agaribacter flavus]|uniref:Response regulator n=1 Tax=Agaribacter flavus TaxID=1902781 RepID=A0ABV7FP81_9ALTE
MALSILIVDDSEADQFLSAHTIAEYDPSAKIHKAYDGEEAINMLLGGDCVPDCIFLDINMPRMNGIEFLERYGKLGIPDSTVIVMLTSSIRDDDYNQCMAFPYVKACLPKPLSIDELPKYLLVC